jgi:hypothetical protein
MISCLLYADESFVGRESMAMANAIDIKVKDESFKRSPLWFLFLKKKKRRNGKRALKIESSFPLIVKMI